MLLVFVFHFLSSQSLRPFYVATAMTYGTKPSTAVPSPETYVKNALNTLGISRRNTGYWSHGIQVLLTNALFTSGPG